MAYRCDQAVIGGAREPIRCKVSGTVCAHQKMCMMEGRIVLTDKAMTCPARDGKLPDPEPVRTEKTPDVDAAEKEPAKKAPAKKTAAKKTTASKKKV